MPFGSLIAHRKECPVKEKKPKMPPKPKLPTPIAEREPVYPAHTSAVDSWRLRILIVGRTMSGVRELLCSVYENMTKSMLREGLSYYTVKDDAIKLITETKRRLERFFWEFSQAPWPASADEEARSYTFRISPSGAQTKAIDLEFVCTTCDGEPDAQEAGVDAVWYLLDAPTLDPELTYDKFRSFLQQELSRTDAEGAPKPRCLLLSQIEKQGCFSVMGEQALLKPHVQEALLSRCRELFGTTGNGSVAVIPLQIYGGLEYHGIDDRGAPILMLSRSGYMQSYIPENCQIPCLYTIEAIARARSVSVFDDMPCGDIKKVIRRHFAMKKGQNGWMPHMLWEVMEDET